MLIGATQTQSLYASVKISGTFADVREAVPRESDTPVGDLLDVRNHVDEGYASRVLENAMRDRLQAAMDAAGVEGTSAEDLLATSMDTSPAATAERIVEFATSLYANYAANHEGEEAEATLEEFVSMIRGAIDEGFGEAREILSGLGRIPASVEDGIEETYELTMKGLDHFLEEQRGLLDQASEGEEQGIGVL